MKLDPKAQLGPVAVASTSKQPFKQLLAEARSELQHGRPATPPGLRARVHAMPQAVSAASQATSAQALCRARTQANGEAQRLLTARAEAHEHARAANEVRHERGEGFEARTVERMLEIIAREFSAEAVPPGAHPEVVHLPPPNVVIAAPKTELDPETKAAQAVDLIERIEVFVKSQRPGLALTLNNSLGAHVEIERIGPREIALKLVGHRGPPSAEAVSRIREELRARGLKVSALSVA